MSTQSKKPIIQAMLGQPNTSYPVWFMRQAGRYLEEYRAIRAERSFLETVFDAEVASEVTLQPLKRFPRLNGAIIFSDILLPALALGQDLTFAKDHGPLITPPLRTPADLERFQSIDMQVFEKTAEAIKLTKAQLEPNQTMLGFAGAPFTVASYLIEGQGSKNYTEVKKLALCEPETFKRILKGIADITVDYLSMQAKAGAEALMLFDSWAGHVDVETYNDLIAPINSEMIEKIRQRCGSQFLIFYPGQNICHLTQAAQYDIDVLSLDWRYDLEQAILLSQIHNPRLCFQGNLDPQYLMAPKEKLAAKVEQIADLAQTLAPHRHIFNVGHGLMPHTPVEGVQTVLETLAQYEQT